MPQSEGTKKRGIPVWVHTIIFFAIMFGVSQIPAPAPLTPLGMKAVAIFLALIYGWTAIGLIWPSVAGIIAMAVFGVMPLNQVFSSGLGGNVVTLLIFMMVIAKNLEMSGISKFIGLWFVSRKIVRGRPWLLSFFLMVAIASVTSLTSGAAMIILGWVILEDILNEAECKPFEGFSTYMMIGIGMASILGNGIFSFRTVGAVAFGVLTNVSGYVLNDLVFAIWQFIFCFFLLGVYALMGKFVFKIDASKIKAMDEAYFEKLDLSLDLGQKVILVLMVILVVAMLAPSVMPTTWPIYGFFKTLGSNGTAALICVLMCIIRIQGKPLMEPKVAFGKGISWDVVLIGASILPLATGTFNSADAGVSAFLAQVFSPIVQGQSGVVFLILVAVISTILTNFITNVTIPPILYPAFYPIASAVGVGPVELMVVIVIACGFSMLLPSACPMAAIMFGNRDWISVKDIYKYVGIYLGVCLVFFVLTVPIVQILFP